MGTSMVKGHYQFYTADVFTNQPFGGNPLAVFPEAGDLTDAEMQRIANEFNLSETVFVFPPQAPQHTKRLRIFTPQRELPFAGHPTVGAALVLANIGAVACTSAATSITFEEAIGPIPVTIRTRDGRPSQAQFAVAQLPTFGPPAPAPTDVAAALSLSVDDLALEALPIQAASCGIPFLYVPVKHLSGVARARVHMPVWEACVQAYWAPNFYVFTRETVTPQADVHARMFGPEAGVVEDPATGSAAAALAAVLAPTAAQQAGTQHWRIEQGFEMKRPSLIEVEADLSAGAITAVRVGGQAVMISQGTLHVRHEGAGQG